MEKSNGCKVCVTGGAGYLGSWLVKKLLDRGYTVHATLRNLDDVSKVSLLKSFPGADARLALFKADMYNPGEFESAIHGCEFVFHVATPLHHTEGSQFENTTEATIAAAKSIAMSCVRSGTVKRLIYTGTVVAASPLKDDGSVFKEFMDETCWTPLNLSIPYSNDFLKDYQDSKTLTEKEILSFGDKNCYPFEVVTLACGLVGGDTLLSFVPGSVAVLVSQLTNKEIQYGFMKYVEELLGKIPIVHIDDVCEAHVFCMENRSVRGRFLCARSYISCAEIASYYQEHHPQFHLKKE
ncbi:hypothetical protein L484_017599 [Morus notabilis]|uniref:NAD-dependent epimerase/dehydratase domain-containing protein n=2 Tax=Morus notabilis TaxID=981085 RepID=W9RAH4_9ROSA|nr:hypothetical protein L484_017599 [Morus notabilis]